MKIDIVKEGGETLHSLHLEPGEYKFVVSGGEAHFEPKGPTGFLDHVKRALPVLLVAALMVVYAALDRHYGGDRTVSFYLFVQSFLLWAFFLVLSILAMITLTKIFTGQFHVWWSGFFVLLGFLGFYVVKENLLGLRWMLPSVFWFHELYELIGLLWFCGCLWVLSRMWFPRFNLWLKGGFLALFLGFVFVVEFLRFFPVDDTTDYLRPETPPPLFEIFESTPLPVDEFLNGLGE